MNRFLHLFNAIAWGCMLLAAVIQSCDRATEKREFLGSAIVESQRWQVSSTVAGQIIAVYADEGQKVEKGQFLALIDTIPLRLQLDELLGAIAELQAQLHAAEAQVEATRAEVRGAKRELDRIRSLVDKGSMPPQQKDLLETQYESASLKLRAASASLSALSAKRRTLEARQAQLRDQLRRCIITAPASATITARYRSNGEMTTPGAPLFEMAATDTVWADFYAPQPVVGQLSIGQTVQIRVDSPYGPSKAVFLPSVITWISDEAEFSPKNIQTRQARNELVFKVRVRAANPDGLLKRGLPVEIWRHEK